MKILSFEDVSGVATIAAALMLVALAVLSLLGALP